VAAAPAEATNEDVFPHDWSPDGRQIAIAGQFGISVVSVERLPHGTSARTLDVDVRRMAAPAFSGIDVHPDGKRLVFASEGTPRSEVWVLENFLPALQQPIATLIADASGARAAVAMVVMPAWDALTSRALRASSVASRLRV
jgi:Tol biopolymer transport system component